jgi:hypothetical protein
MLNVVLETSMYVSFSQLIISDITVSKPGCHWTAAHVAQGFARRVDAISFLTLIEFGESRIQVVIGKLESSGGYVRVVGVPFQTTSGQVAIRTPEASEPATIEIMPGHYWVCCAQSLDDTGGHEIALSFERVDEPLQRSRVILADAELNPGEELVETAEVA